MPIDPADAESRRQTRYTLRLEDLIAAQSCFHASGSLKPFVLATTLPVIPIYLLVALFLYIEAAPDDLWRLMTHIFLVMFVACGATGILGPLAWQRWGAPWVVQRGFRRLRSRPGEFVVSWDAARIYFSSDNSETRIPFADYLQWAESRDVILLFQSKVTFQMLPKRVLTLAQVADLRSVARQAGLPGTDAGR